MSSAHAIIPVDDVSDVEPVVPTVSPVVEVEDAEESGPEPVSVLVPLSVSDTETVLTVPPLV
ncbi:MAG TPA: hypothetical protein PKW35_25695, partial [Nannocystaceae bacterium]|nr:hypothetical protein [Nannocystaceae bacterium]